MMEKPGGAKFRRESGFSFGPAENCSFYYSLNSIAEVLLDGNTSTGHTSLVLV